MSKNRMALTKNPFQGSYKKVLCVCAGGLLRSPTAALVLSMDPFNFNTRSCGMDQDYALIAFDEALLSWADEIVCVNSSHEETIRKMTSKPVINLDIPDIYDYRDPELMELIKTRYQSKKV